MALILKTQPIIPPGLRKSPCRPVNSGVKRPLLMRANFRFGHDVVAGFATIFHQAEVGHNPPVEVTFQFPLVVCPVSELSGRYAAVKLMNPLPQPGQ